MVSKDNKLPTASPFGQLDEFFTRLSDPFNHTQMMASSSSPMVDVEHNDGEIIVTADLPGFSTDDINIECDENRLTIRAERQSTTSESSESEDTYHQQERLSVQERMIPLPVKVNKEGVTATYTNGVLSITMPVLEKESSNVEIRTE